MIVISILLLTFIFSSWLRKKIEVLLPVFFTATAIVGLALAFVQRIALLNVILYALTVICLAVYIKQLIRKEYSFNVSKIFTIYLLALLVLFIFYAVADFSGLDASSISSSPEYEKVSDVLEASITVSPITQISSSGFRLLNVFEFLVASSSFLSNPWGILLGKNIFLMTLLLPLLSCISTSYIKDIKRTVICLVVSVFLIFIASTNNEFTTINPYFINGLLVGSALVYMLLFIEKHEWIYLFGGILLVIGSCLENRIGIYSALAFIATVVLYILLRCIDNIKKSIIRKVCYAGLAIIILVVVYLYRIKVVGDDPFEKDVYNTFFNASFTPYRYGVGIGSIQISFVYIVILLLGALVIANRYYKTYFDALGKNAVSSAFLNYGLFIWSIVLMLIIGGMYSIFWGRNNFNSIGEYLTGFENYVQCPLVTMAYYYSATTLRALAMRRGKNEGTK